MDYLIYFILFLMVVIALAWAGKIIGYYVGEGFFKSKREHFIHTINTQFEGEE